MQSEPPNNEHMVRELSFFKELRSVSTNIEHKQLENPAVHYVQNLLQSTTIEYKIGYNLK